jgi:hypothetical protein
VRGSSGEGTRGKGGLAGREAEKPRVTEQGEEEGCPETWGPRMERGMKQARFGINRGRRRTAVRRGAWEET